MQRLPDVMRPSAEKLRAARGERDPKQVGAAAAVDWRTVLLFESGGATDRFQFNALNRLAAYYDLPFDSLLEPVPVQDMASQKPYRKAVLKLAQVPA